MHPVLEYFLKVNLLMVFFGIFYYAFLKKETFYQLNRWYFIVSILFSFTAPFIIFTQTVVVNAEPQFYQNIANPNIVTTEIIEKEALFNSINWQQVAIYFIVAISTFFVLKKLISVLNLYRAIKTLPSFKNTNIKFNANSTTIYSFYKWIVVPENIFDWENHQLILDHENIHIVQKHTFDLIFIELVASIFWFNPFLKLLQKSINTNLEFIVDNEMILKTEKIHYQKNLLLFQKTEAIQFVNSYSTSEIKNRILQLNTKKSHNMKKLKFLLAAPALVAFFGLFQIETVAQVIISKNIQGKVGEVKSEQKFKPNQNHTTNKDTVLVGTSERQSDLLEILDAVNDLNKFKTDRATFDKIVARIPVSVDNILMNKNDLKNFDLAKVQSLHLDMSNRQKGTTLNLSTKPTNQENLRSFSFSIANFESIKIHGEDATKEELEKHIDDTNAKREAIELPVKKTTDIISKSENGKDYLQDVIETDNGMIITKEGNIVANNPTRIILKGESSKNLLYIVDGKEINTNDFSKIHPEDIESITVLKDKKAIEKYGKKGKDGVLLITTKAKKDVSLQQKTQALKARELALKERKQIIKNKEKQISQLRKEREKQRQELISKRNEISEKTQQRRKELEKLKKDQGLKVSVKSSLKTNKNLTKDFKTVSNLFYDVKKDVKKLEDEHFKITNITTSLKYDNGEEIKFEENFK